MNSGAPPADGRAGISISLTSIEPAVSETELGHLVTFTFNDPLGTHTVSVFLPEPAWQVAPVKDP